MKFGLALKFYKCENRYFEEQWAKETLYYDSYQVKSKKLQMD